MSTPLCVTHPSLPRYEELPLPTEVVSAIVVVGRIPPSSNRFHFDLQTQDGNICFHLNPRFGDCCSVVRNSLHNGEWNDEESDGDSPFTPGEEFEAVIYIKDSGFKVSVNGAHFCEYSHRVPKEKFRIFGIGGEVEIIEIRFNPTGATLKNPPIPINACIPGGMRVGRMVKVQGQVGLNPSRFNINLVHGSGFPTGADVAFQIDTRFQYGRSRNVVVRNSRQGKRWGKEEKETPFFPCAPGQPFEVVIRAEESKFTIDVNGQHMYDYDRRLQPLHAADHLFINGDITLTLVQIQ